MRNRLRKTISVVLVALYAIAGVGGDGLHYFVESPTLAEPSPTTELPGHTFAHCHDHGHGPGSHWHFHHVPRIDHGEADAAAKRATNLSQTRGLRFASDDDHDHGCLLLALVSALELSLSLISAELADSTCVARALQTPPGQDLSPIGASYLARGPPRLATA